MVKMYFYERISSLIKNCISFTRDLPQMNFNSFFVDVRSYVEYDCTRAVMIPFIFGARIGITVGAKEPKPEPIPRWNRLQEWNRLHQMNRLQRFR